MTKQVIQMIAKIDIDAAQRKSDRATNTSGEAASCCFGPVSIDKLGIVLLSEESGCLKNVVMTFARYSRALFMRQGMR